VEVGLGDLDVIAETDVKRTFRLRMPVRSCSARSRSESQVLLFGERSAQAVELGVVAGADIIAVGEVVGEFVGQRGAEQVAQGVRELRARALRVERPPCQDPKSRRARRGRRRDLGEGVFHAAEFARVAEAVLEAAEDARDVADFAEQFANSARSLGWARSSPTTDWRRLISGRSRVGAASQRSRRRAPAAVARCG
jgi:hypothetical protein